MRVELRHVPCPALEVPVERPEISAEEYILRARMLYEAVDLDWVAVYGDREHFANLMWLTGYDPRFEEALLVLGPDDRRVLFVGVEGVDYAEIAGLPAEIRFYPPWSIVGQPHTDSPTLSEMLRDIGMKPGDRVGIVGWKTVDPRETGAPAAPAFVPALLPRIIERVTGTRVTDVTATMIDPDSGLRTRNSATQIAIFEWGAARASAAVLRVVRGIRPGMTELEAAGLFGYQGEPLTMHPIITSGSGKLIGLRSPTSRMIASGDAISAAIGYWGGLTCRAGLVSDTPDDEFVTRFVQPYFRTLATWWMTIGIGITGGEVMAAITAALGDAPFRSFVNPGHLTSYDEWLHSPVHAESTIPIASGMVLAADIIPAPLPPGRALNCEDTVAIAGTRLRAELAERFPAVWERMQARRRFMTDALGIRLRPEVLPLSIAPAYLPPFWLDPELVCVVAG